MVLQTETKAGAGFKAGVKDYRLTYCIFITLQITLVAYKLKVGGDLSAFTENFPVDRLLDTPRDHTATQKFDISQTGVTPEECGAAVAAESSNLKNLDDANSLEPLLTELDVFEEQYHEQKKLVKFVIKNKFTLYTLSFVSALLFLPAKALAMNNLLNQHQPDPPVTSRLIEKTRGNNSPLTVVDNSPISVDEISPAAKKLTRKEAQRAKIEEQRVLTRQKLLDIAENELPKTGKTLIRLMHHYGQVAQATLNYNSAQSDYLGETNPSELEEKKLALARAEKELARTKKNQELSIRKLAKISSQKETQINHDAVISEEIRPQARVKRAIENNQRVALSHGLPLPVEQPTLDDPATQQTEQQEAFSNAVDDNQPSAVDDNQPNSPHMADEAAGDLEVTVNFSALTGMESPEFSRQLQEELYYALNQPDSPAVVDGLNQPSAVYDGLNQHQPNSPHVADQAAGDLEVTGNFSALTLTGMESPDFFRKFLDELTD